MNKGDQVVLSFTGTITEIFKSSASIGGIDIIEIETEQGIQHMFWPAEESSVTVNVLAKGNN
jgi:hypothetical protein